MITALEQKAASSRKAREYTLSKNEKEIIAKMVEKYGDDYKVCVSIEGPTIFYANVLQKMVWDKKNVNQLTEGQLRRKCILLQRS